MDTRDAPLTFLKTESFFANELGGKIDAGKDFDIYQMGALPVQMTDLTPTFDPD